MTYTFTMENGHTSCERVLKSFGFSVAMFLLCSIITGWRARKLAGPMPPTEWLWLFYNATVAVLFLIRTRPSVVSTHPIHWMVALGTSFSGFFFKTYERAVPPLLATVSESLILVGLSLGAVAALSLGRSYDFLPALRGTQTGSVYRVARHPMYSSSILIRLGYLVRHFSAYNMIVSVLMVWLYDNRANFEEKIMLRDPDYREYTQKVRFKFLPGVY